MLREYSATLKSRGKIERQEMSGRQINWTEQKFFGPRKRRSTDCSPITWELGKSILSTTTWHLI